jgi:hypothetical protein
LLLFSFKISISQYFLLRRTEMGNRIAKLYTRSKVGYRKPGKRLTDLPEGETYTLFWYIGTKKKAKAVGRYADEAQVALINCGKVWVLEQSLPNACVTVCSKGGFSLLLFANHVREGALTNRRLPHTAISAQWMRTQMIGY